MAGDGSGVASLISEFFNQFRFADAIDIAIVAVFIHLLLTWFKNRASQSLAIVILVMVGVFLLARWLDLYLTTMLFQFGLVGSLLMLIIVFQQDIRHGLERIASSHWFRRSTTVNPSEKFVDTIVETTDVLARQRVGALLVFPGREPLDPHVRGGVSVDAEISQPLLLSIFHPKSPGHDGAVLISENRIGRLGAHLPLTTNLSQLSEGGTRHAAAIGLSEQCDALIVVVSEERGTIKIAREGMLTTTDAATLAEQLHRYLSDQSVTNRRAVSHPREDAATMVASLLLATVLWFIFAYQTTTVQRSVVVPIEYRNLPNGWVVEEPKPTHAEVTLSGSDRAFRLLDVPSLAVSLEMKDVREGTPIILTTEGSLRNVPAELTVNEVIPRTLVVTLQKSDPAGQP